MAEEAEVAGIRWRAALTDKELKPAGDEASWHPYALGRFGR
jgi:hypothetical protein